MTQALTVLVAAALAVFILGLLITIVKCYRKVEPGTAMVRRGYGGPRVSFNGMLVFPIFHRADVMDVSVKRVEIYRHGSEGLICKDNVRADIKVAFFMRVNNVEKDVLQVADSLGVRRASDQAELVELFDAKFSEALKTVGKKFDFTELYTERDRFKDEILAHIGTDLNGYVLDDAAVDYLEQTDLAQLDPNNILDAEGIKKIADLTAREAIRANEINREKEKTIKKQDVEARETILELERQQADAESKQQREIAVVRAREQAEADKVREEERLKAQRARITTEEELGIAEENKQRQVLVALRSKERTDGIEQERVTRERDLEATDRERVVELARIDKEKALEVERKKIQDVIRERVVVERAVVEEQQRIHDTEELMTAERAKQVKVIGATALAEESKIKEVKMAEASREASKFQADEILIEAEANRQSAEKQAQGKMKLAEATRAEAAAGGLAEAEVLDAKAGAIRNYGTAEADVVAAKGLAEAKALQQKYEAEATGVAAKADAMKKLDGVGRDHEEFKLRLNKDRDIEIAAINIQRDVAAEQAKVLGEALKQANIDIVGGDSAFFDRIVNSITAGKQVDRFVGNSDTARLVRDTFFSGNGEGFGQRLREFSEQFGVSAEDLKNLTVSALLAKLLAQSADGTLTDELRRMIGYAQSRGLADRPVHDIAAVTTTTTVASAAKPKSRN
ncbi:MAG: flotillin family protein [Phycisphaeraceae bacterium]